MLGNVHAADHAALLTVAAVVRATLTFNRRRPY